MPPDPSTLPGAIGFIVWYMGEVTFKWVPGFVVSFANSAAGTQVPPSPAPPTITQPMTVLDVAQFLQANSAPGVYDELYKNWYGLIAVSVTLSLIFAAILIYSIVRTFGIRQTEYKHYQAIAQPVAAKDIPKVRLRWDRILEEANSENDQNRRLAVLEADIMLGELLDDLGYRGETLADKMRQVPKAQFNTIDLAWEAHRARNRIAHESGYQMSPYEARRIIGLYDKVFREFGFIES
jgi:hypothetical protein